MKLFKSKEEKAQISAAEQEYAELLQVLQSEYAELLQVLQRDDPSDVRSAARSFRERRPALDVLSARERQRLNEQAFRQYAERVLEDDFLTIDEEMAFDEVVASLDISDEDFLTKHRDLAERLILASRTRHTSGSSG